MALPSLTPGSTAVVTGASSGIGAELARILAGRGYRLVVVARRADALDALAHELEGVSEVEVIAADLTSTADRDRLDSRVRQAAILVNCAGTGPVGRVSAGHRTEELACVELNVGTIVDLTSRAVGGMTERGAGAILNVASTAAFMPVAGQAVYSASKAFVLSYTSALRHELIGTGITVSALCPGPVRTGFATANGTTDQALFKGLPEPMILSAATVAAAGIDGLARNRDIVVPGRANAAMAIAAQLLPRRLLTRLGATTAPGLRSHD